MAASTQFEANNLIPLGSGNGRTVFFYDGIASSATESTLSDTSALGSYFSSAWAAFSANDLIISVSSTYALNHVVVTAASSTGVTVAQGLTSTGLAL